MYNTGILLDQYIIISIIQIAKRSIISSIKREMSGDLEDGMIAVGKLHR